MFFALLVLALAVSPDQEEISGAASIVLLVLACLAWPLQEPLLTARRGRRNGQSLGKQFLGIRIVRTTGERLSLGRALLRGVIGQGWLPLVLLSGIYTLVDAMIGFASNKRTAVHDLMSGTLVLRADVDPASLAAALPPAPAQPQWSPAGPQWAPPPVPPQDRSWARRHLGWLIAGGVALALAVLAGGVTLIVTQVDFDQFNAEIEADNFVDELRDEPGIFSVSEVDPPDAGWDVQYDINRGEATLYFDSDGLEVTWDYEIDDSAADSRAAGGVDRGRGAGDELRGAVGEPPLQRRQRAGGGWRVDQPPQAASARSASASSAGTVAGSANAPRSASVRMPKATCQRSSRCVRRTISAQPGSWAGASAVQQRVLAGEEDDALDHAVVERDAGRERRAGAQRRGGGGQPALQQAAQRRRGVVAQRLARDLGLDPSRTPPRGAPRRAAAPRSRRRGRGPPQRRRRPRCRARRRPRRARRRPAARSTVRARDRPAAPTPGRRWSGRSRAGPTRPVAGRRGSRDSWGERRPRGATVAAAFACCSRSRRVGAMHGRMLLSLLVLPASAASSAQAATVAAGEAQSCAISAGALNCWGADSSGGDLGRGVDLAPNDTADPGLVAGMDAGVTDVELTFTGSGSGTTGCAIKAGGAFCWGGNSAGQYGNGTTTSGLAPVAVTGLGSGVTKISVATSRACAIHNGAAKCWGASLLGDGTTADSTTPVIPKYLAHGAHDGGQAVALDGGVTDVGAGWRHICAIWNDQVVCSGDNTNGQLGYSGDDFAYSIPYRYHMRPLSEPFVVKPVKLAVGQDSNCALLENGSVWCWGSNESGRLGIGSLSNADENDDPRQVVGLDSGVTDISINSKHVCVIKSGEVWCWGDGQAGKLGNGSTDAQGGDSGVPVKVANLTGVTSVAAGGGHTCAIAGGERWCWGSNNHLQLGTDAIESFSGVPVKVTGATPPTPPAPTPPVVVPPPPATPPVPTATITVTRGAARLSRTRIATLATILCPASANVPCRLIAPKTLKIKIKRKTFTVKILVAGSIPRGGRVSLRTQLTAAARRRLGRTTVTIKVPISTVVNGVSRRTTVTARVTGRS